MAHHLADTHVPPKMQQCIANCSDCHDVCLATIAHCLRLGGGHAAREHITALLDCAQACESSRDFMLRGSTLHAGMCGFCADACERCAESCEQTAAGDEVMRNCAEICRRCAESCRQMAGVPGRQPADR